MPDMTACEEHRGATYMMIDWGGVGFCVLMVGVFAIITGSTPSTFSILLKTRGVDPAIIGLNAAMTSAGLLC